MIQSYFRLLNDELAKSRTVNLSLFSLPNFQFIFESIVCGPFSFIKSPFHCSLFCLCIADDPYYCGLRARVSNFVKNKNTNEKPVKELGTEIKMKMTPHVGTYQAALSHGHPMQTHQMWHSRSFDSGMGNWVWQLFLMHKLWTFPTHLLYLGDTFYGTTVSHWITTFFFFTFYYYFPIPKKKRTHLIQTFPFLWLASTSASSFPSARLLFNRKVKEKIMIIKRGENMKLPIFNQKELVLFVHKKNTKQQPWERKSSKAKWFPLFIDLVSLAFSHFSYAKRTASLPSSVTPDIQRLWKAYPFERNPTSWVPSHPHGYSPGESFPVPIPYPFESLPK